MPEAVYTQVASLFKFLLALPQHCRNNRIALQPSDPEHFRILSLYIICMHPGMGTIHRWAHRGPWGHKGEGETCTTYIYVSMGAEIPSFPDFRMIFSEKLKDTIYSVYGVKCQCDGIEKHEDKNIVSKYI